MELYWLKYVLAVLILAVGGCTAAPAGNGRIAYLSWDENGRVQLYTTHLNGGSPEQLTDTAGDVHSFAVSPDGSQLVYVVQMEDDRSQLWRLAVNGRFFSPIPQKLLTCDNALCSQPIWAPDGRRLIYERQERRADGSPGLPALWWLDTQTGETIPVLEDAQPPNQAAALSPEGQWLSYSSPADEGVYVYHLQNGRFFHISSRLGFRAAWDPTGNQLIISDLDTVIFHEGEETDHLQHDHDFAQAIHLFVTDTDSEQRRRLTQGGSVDDGTPIWSPDGQWVAFGRKLMNTNTGRQLWLVRADGSEEIPLTDDLTIHHGVPSWSEDGRFLLYQHFNTTTPDIPPSIRIINIRTQAQEQIVPIGFQPIWLNQ